MRHRPELSDAEMLALLRRDPALGWQRFLDRYADFVFRYLQRLGFDYDEAMDRFVYVCEKLRERDCRRLCGVRHLGRDGELIPWLRTVIDRLAINWAWSVEGRERLLRPIEKLPPRDQRVFELYFRGGLTPSEIAERLRAEDPMEVEPLAVFGALERVLGALSQRKRWRLVSRLIRRRGAASLTLCAEGPRRWEPADRADHPEDALLRRERDDRLHAALSTLPDRQRLILQLRFEEAMSHREIAAALGLTPRKVGELCRGALQRLRQTLSDERWQVSSVGGS